MKTPTQLIALITAGLSLSLAAPVLALPVPDGKAAIAEAVVGKVRYNEGQGLKTLHVGDSLAPGANIQTGNNGRATLTLAEDAIMRIAPNTEMTLKEEKVRKGTFLQLTRGLARFLVGKRAPGYAFEVQTQNAVAAVKGTDWDDDAGDGKGPTKATVYASKNKVALLLSGEGGKTTKLAPGESVGFDGKEFKVTQLSDEDRKKADDIFKALPPIKHDESEKEKDKDTAATGGTPGPTPAATPDPKDEKAGLTDEDKAALKAEMKEVTDKVIAEATHDLYVDGFILRDTKTGDLQAGKIIYDRFGDRVQVSHYITREDPDAKPVVTSVGGTTITISSFSLRDAGPNKGVSSAIESSQYNTILPQNWGAIFSEPLDDPSNLDSNGYPIYFKTNELFVAQNPSLDTVTIETWYDDPVFLPLDGATPLFQGKEQLLTVFSGIAPVVVAPPADTVTQVHAAMAKGDGPVPTVTESFDWYYGVYGDYDSDTHLAGELPTYSYFSHFDSVATATEAGGWSFALTVDYADHPILTQDLHFIRNNGSVLPLPSFSGDQLPANVFKGYNNNIELALKSPLFDGRSIDLVFLPGFYDLYDMLTLPADTGDCECE